MAMPKLIGMPVCFIQYSMVVHAKSFGVYTASSVSRMIRSRTSVTDCPGLTFTRIMLSVRRFAGAKPMAREYVV